MSAPPDSPHSRSDRVTNERIACVALSLVTALMVSMPGNANDAPDTWWLALSLATFTIACVFPRHPLLVGAAIGLGAPLAQCLVALALGPASPAPAIDSHLLALVPAACAAFLGARTRRALSPVAVPVRR
jgi:hypothetical protein